MLIDETLVWLFVYGTLKKGGALYTGAESMCIEDQINGTMHTLGAYPAVRGVLDVFDPSEPIVYGERHLLKRKYLEHYDSIEGSCYSRIKTVTKKGLTCYVYEFKHELSEDTIVEGGTWNA